MSGPSKRIHEEGGHPTPLKRPYEEAGIFSTPGKLNQIVTNDFHLPVEHGPEGRSAKVQRIDAREFDKRPSQLHRVSTSSTNSTDQQAASENRLELKSSKDVRDIKSETQEVKQDVRGMYTCTKIDLQISKADNDVRMEPRVDEKELRTDRSSHIDFRGDIKFEKDNYSVAGSHSTWRDTKENNRNKKFYEPVNDGSDSWRIARDAQQSNSEVPKDLSIVKERVPNETHEAVGENKIDVKGEKFRDKDRKRSREFGEKDKDRNDRRNNVQLGGPNIDSKELREERDVDKWERDRKDVQEDKEHYDREKDSVKRELPNANEKESQHHEKESADGSVRITEQENTTGEPKKQKDDGWKPSDRDIKEKKRERDLDLGDRHEQRSKPGEKESDDLCAEGYGIAEKDKEAFGGVQQRKRMSRTRGNPQTPHREPRFRCRARDSDGSQGKQESSMLVYKAGECMQEILKSWKEHEASQDNKNDESLQDGPILEIRILAEYVTSTNRQVKGAQLWGTDIYTNDSDLVAVLMHTGYCCPTSTPPPSAIQELRATIRVLPPKDCYTSSLRNNVRSRAWGAGIGCSYCVERCCIVKKGGGTIDLEPRLTHTSAVEPTLAPVSVERTMTTRAAASNALRQQRFVREVTIQYNLCNEPWLKYTLSLVADKGLKKPLYTSARLKKGEVLYLETRVNRYELCFNGEKPLSTSSHVHEMEHDKHQNHSSHVQNGDRHSSDRENIRDAFRWSRCKKAFPEKTMRSLGIPLPLEQLEVLEDNLDWEDVQWSQNAVWVAGKEYPLVRAHFLSPN